MISGTLGHYRIVEKLGSGGMGEVYRAYDEHLERDVALKVLPSGTLTDESARKRFRQEALTLSKLNHPNIATVFDYATQDGVDFLVMELVRGTPLSERLENGSLAEQEISRLGLQLAEGLAAAHQQGVIHRDLKPANLMIAVDGRMKILDFGLATLTRQQTESDATRTLTEATSVSGTLPYMSPECLRGHKADARSDIYGAGAVLYEMATGRPPFPQRQQAELIGAIIHETPSPPGTLNPHLTPALGSVVMKALAKEPANRYQSARELLVAIEGTTSVTASVQPRRRMLLALGAVAGLVLIPGLLVLSPAAWRHRKADASISGARPPTKSRHSVAVLGFKNVSARPEKAWLSTALSEMLNTELAAGEQLRTVPGETVARMRTDLSLADADGYASDTLTKIRKTLDSDYVLLGSYLAIGDSAGGRLRIDLRLQDTVAGETIASVSQTGTEAQVFDLVLQAGMRLRDKLGVGELTPGESGDVRASLPADPETARLYSEGLEKLRLPDAVAARDLLARVVSADPNNALAHSGLASAWQFLGYDSKARDEARKAFDLSGNLSREDRLLIEGRYRVASHEWDKAIEIYGALFGFFPDNLEYGLLLAGAQLDAGKSADSLKTVEALRRLRSPSSEDPRIDLQVALAARMSGDYKKDQAAAAAAAARGEAMGARLLVVRARLTQCWAWRELGDHQKALQACHAAKRIAAGAGDDVHVASALVNMGVLLYDAGDNAAAERTYEEALVIARKAGNQHNVEVVLNNLALVRRNLGDLPGAVRSMEQSLQVSREVGNRQGVAITLGNLGTTFELRGDLTQALRYLNEALALKQQIGDKAGTAFGMYAVGQVLSSRGELAGAQRMFEQGLAIAHSIGNKRIAGVLLSAIGHLQWTRDDLAAARKSYAEALDLHQAAGEKGAVAQMRLALAGLSIEEGHAVEEEGIVRELREEFRKQKLVDSEIFATCELARAYLARGKVADAAREMESIRAPAAKTTDHTSRIEFEIADARVAAASSHAADARKNLQVLLADPRSRSFTGYDLETRLAVCEVEKKSETSAASPACFLAVENDATAKGYLWIARKAAEGRAATAP